MSSNNFSLRVNKRALWIKRISAVLVLGGFGWLVFSAVSNTVDNEDLNPSLVKAPLVIKERPENPGGMEIAHQDKQLFDLLESEESASNVSEKVVKKSQAVEDRTQQLAKQAIEKKEIAKQVEQKVQQQATQELEVSKPIQQEVKKEPEAPVVNKVQVQEAVAEQYSGWAVQLGSFTKVEDANASVTIYNKKVGNILIGLTPYVKKTDLGAKGIFYRVYYTGLKDGEHAKQICQQLKIQKQACLRAKL